MNERERLHHLVSRWNRMAELTDLSLEAVEGALDPILSVFGGYRGRINKIEHWGSHIHVGTIDHCPCCPYYRDFEIPLSIWKSETPTLAAKEYMEQKTRNEKQARIEDKKRQIQDLLEEIGEPNDI